MGQLRPGQRPGAEVLERRLLATACALLATARCAAREVDLGPEDVLVFCADRRDCPANERRVDETCVLADAAPVPEDTGEGAGAAEGEAEGEGEGEGGGAGSAQVVSQRSGRAAQGPSGGAVWIVAGRMALAGAGSARFVRQC